MLACPVRSFRFPRLPLTFVEFSLERQRRKLVWLCASAEPWEWLFAFGWMIGASVLLLIWWAWYEKKTLRETAEWEELQRVLTLE